MLDILRIIDSKWRSQETTHWVKCHKLYKESVNSNDLIILIIQDSASKSQLRITNNWFDYNLLSFKLFFLFRWFIFLIIDTFLSSLKKRKKNNLNIVLLRFQFDWKHSLSFLRKSALSDINMNEKDIVGFTPSPANRIQTLQDIDELFANTSPARSFSNNNPETQSNKTTIIQSDVVSSPGVHHARLMDFIIWFMQTTSGSRSSGSFLSLLFSSIVSYLWLTVLRHIYLKRRPQV